jgi:hypothetical protein
MNRLFTTLLPCLALGAGGTAQETVTPPPTDPETAQEAETQETPKPVPMPSAIPPLPQLGPRDLTRPPQPRGSGLGTEVLGAPPELPSAPAAPVTTAQGVPAPPAPPLPLHWGSLSFHPHLAYNLLYGTGILSGPGREEDTFLNTLAPGLTLKLGPRWSLDYTASLQFYSSEQYDDTMDHAVSLSGSVVWDDWLFSLGYAYRSSSSPLAETAAQTDQDTHNTVLGGTHRITDKTSLELGLAQALRFTQDYTDSYTWSTTDWLDYQWRPRFGVAAGLSAGYDMLDPGTDMTSEQILMRVRGQTLDKLGYSVAGGVEFRQFLDSDADTKISPTVDASVSYQLFEPTTVSAFFSHDVGTSYYSNQFTENTSFGAAVRQRFLGKLFLNLSGGYTFQKYSSTLVSDFELREDDRAYFQAGLNTRFLRRGSASVFYRWSENNSDNDDFAYDSNQIGLQLAYAW